jgi:hypothetical protein
VGRLEIALAKPAREGQGEAVTHDRAQTALSVESILNRGHSIGALK